MTPIPSDAWSLLSYRLKSKRRDKMLAVARERTKHIRLVLQDVHDPHNIAACLRSADAFGICDVDVMSLNNEKIKKSQSARGTGHWLNLKEWNELSPCIEALKDAGYKIAAGFPPSQAHMNLDEIPLSDPLAVVFGNEHAGIDPHWLSHIDYKFTIPMVGMVESLNISVSAAITLQNLTHKGRKELPKSQYFLSESEQTELLNRWIYQHCAKPDIELTALRSRATPSPSPLV